MCCSALSAGERQTACSGIPVLVAQGNKGKSFAITGWTAFPNSLTEGPSFHPRYIIISILLLKSDIRLTSFGASLCFLAALMEMKIF